MQDVDTTSVTLTGQEFNTVLASLRYYQHRGMGDPAARPDWLQAIACPSPDATSLDDDGIDSLCERMNTTTEVAATSASGEYVHPSPGDPTVLYVAPTTRAPVATIREWAAVEMTPKCQADLIAALADNLARQSRD